MRSFLVLLAGLASSALAYPTDVSVDRRTFGLIAEILGSVGSEVTTIIDDVLGLSGSSSTTLLSGLSARGAAALEGGVLGCGASVIHASARAELKSWLVSQTSITGSIKTSLVSWCEGSITTLEESAIAALAVYVPTCAELAAKESIYVTIDGIFEASELEATLVLSASAQTSLTAFIEAHVDLDVNVIAGLNLCAGGGIVGSLTADVKASLLAWVSASDCSLSASLQAAVLAWIKGESCDDLVEIGTISTDALTAISVGGSIEVLVEESGILSTSAMASIAAFLEAEVDIDVNVRAALKACGEGKLASSLSLEVRAALALWLTESSCSLGVELKAVVLLWLSVAVTAEVSVDIVSDLLVDITGFLTEEIIALLSVNLRGALALLEAGESLTLLSWSTRAELAAFLGGCTTIDISVTIKIIILEWLTGCSIGSGSGSGSSPSSTPVVSIIPSATGSIPAGSVPTGSVSIPSGGVPTGSISIPEGTSPTGSVSIPSGSTPSGSAGSGPSPSSPAGGVPGYSSVPSGPAPSESSGSGSAPSGPAGGATSGSAPAPTGPAGSGSVPSGPAPTGSEGSGSAPSGPAGSETASAGMSSGCGASPSETGAPGGGAAPSETSVWVAPTATVAPGGGSGSGGYTETVGYTETAAWSSAWTETIAYTETAGYTETVVAPAPTTAPAGVSPESVWTSTIIITKTVCGCEA